MTKAKNFPFRRIPMTMSSLILLCAMYFGTVMNYPVLKAIFSLSSDVSNSLFPYTAPLLLTCAFVIIFSAFAWPYVFKPFMCFVVLTSAGALYAAVNFQTMFDSTMMESVFETNSSEILFYLNFKTVFYLFAFGVYRAFLLLLCASNRIELGSMLLSLA